MNCSFDGIGQWAATFPRAAGSAGQAVTLNADGRVCTPSDGGDFIGVVLSVGRDGLACSVALGGIVSVPCSGTAPARGWAGLAADGKGGVKASTSGRAFRVLECGDDFVTFVL